MEASQAIKEYADKMLEDIETAEGAHFKSAVVFMTNMRGLLQLVYTLAEQIDMNEDPALFSVVDKMFGGTIKNVISNAYKLENRFDDIVKLSDEMVETTQEIAGIDNFDQLNMH